MYGDEVGWVGASNGESLTSGNEILKHLQLAIRRGGMSIYAHTNEQKKRK